MDISASAVPTPAPRVVVMGVSGAGKSTIGALVADAMNIPFMDGSSLHPIANVRKLAAGTPLTDEDRLPWLEIVGGELAKASTRGVIIACSALKRSYRDAIRAKAPETIFLHLDGTIEVLSARLEGRSGHLMSPALLSLQLAALEPLESDERAVIINISGSITDILVEAEKGIKDALAR